MVGFTEAFLKSLDSYKKYPLESIVFGIGYLFLEVISTIPILGAFIGAYLVPRLLNWFYGKVFGNTSVDYKLSFKAWLFYLLLTNLIVFQLLITFYLPISSVPSTSSSITVSPIGFDTSFYSFSFTQNYSFVSGLLLLMILTLFNVVIQGIVLQIFLLYTIYSVILGKLNEFKIDVEKSTKVFGYSFGWSIIFGAISYAIGIIPIYGYYISLLFTVLFAIPIVQLVIAHKTLSL